MTRCRLIGPLGTLLALGPLWLVLSLGPGCTTVVWYGHSPDRHLRVRVVERDGQQRVDRNGRPGPRFRSIGISALTFSPDSRRLAYPAQCACGSHWFLMTDGRRGPCWDGIGEVRFSPDSRHLAYVALRGKKWRVVRDGRPGPPVDAVYRGSLTWSPGRRPRLSHGPRLSYVAQRGAAKHVVSGGRLGPAFRRVARLTHSADGRLAYLGQRKGGTHVVVGRTVGPPFERVSELLLGPGPRGRVAYVARHRGRWVAVVDGRLSRPFGGVAGLTFSGDGRRVAFAAQQGGRARVVLDGVPQPLYDGIRYQTLTFTSRGTLLYVARNSGRYRVIFGGAPGPAYDAITRPEVRGEGWGYIGRRGRLHDVVLGGRIHHARLRARRVGDLVLGPAGRRYGFVLDRGRSATVVINGRGTTFQLVVPDTLVLSPDGRRWACLAGNRATRTLFFSIDGQRRRPFDSAELTAAVMRRGRPQPGLTRRWAAAELARATARARPRPRPPAPR